MSYINQFVSNVRSDGFLSASWGAACFLLEHDLAFLPAALARVRPRTHTATVDDLSFDVLGDWRPSGGIGKDFPRNGCHEPITSRIILNELQSSGGVFYDIGAATGYFTVLAAQTIPPTNIHVFEPANQSGVLKKNLTRYAPEATLHRRGVGHSESTIRLDDYVQTNPAPTVIKIDVDGAEDGVLAGMYRIIKESSPLVLLEVHNTANYHNICESIRNGFADAGYEFELVKRHRYAGSQRERTTLDSLVEMENSENDYLLICSPE